MLSAIGQQFRKPSGILGHLASALMKKGNMEAYNNLVDRMNIVDGDKLFEIGYGHGKGTKRILETADCSIEGVDFSPLMHKEANRRNDIYVKEGRADLYLGDFLHYKLTESTYNKIFCINVIYFWDDLRIPFSKIRAGLIDGGEFHFYMSSPETLNKIKFTKDHIFNKRPLEEVLKTIHEVGFSDVSYADKKGYFIKCIK